MTCISHDSSHATVITPSEWVATICCYSLYLIVCLHDILTVFQRHRHHEISRLPAHIDVSNKLYIRLAGSIWSHLHSIFILFELFSVNCTMRSLSIVFINITSWQQCLIVSNICLDAENAGLLLMLENVDNGFISQPEAFPGLLIKLCLFEVNLTWIFGQQRPLTRVDSQDKKKMYGHDTNNPLWAPRRNRNLDRLH